MINPGIFNFENHRINIFHECDTLVYFFPRKATCWEVKYNSLFFFKQGVLKRPEITFVCLLSVNFLYERKCERKRLAMNKGVKTLTAVKFAARAVSVKTSTYY